MKLVLLLLMMMMMANIEGYHDHESDHDSTHLPPMWPGFDSQTRRHMWVEFVGSRLCTERFFSGFPLSSKTNISLDLRQLLISIYSVPN